VITLRTTRFNIKNSALISRPVLAGFVPIWEKRAHNFLRSSKWFLVWDSSLSKELLYIDRIKCIYIYIYILCLPVRDCNVMPKDKSFDRFSWSSTTKIFTKKLFSNCKFVKIAPLTVTPSLKGVNKFVIYVLYIYWTVWVQFGMKFHLIMSFSNLSVMRRGKVQVTSFILAERVGTSNCHIYL